MSGTGTYPDAAILALPYGRRSMVFHLPGKATCRFRWFQPTLNPEGPTLYCFNLANINSLDPKNKPEQCQVDGRGVQRGTLAGADLNNVKEMIGHSDLAVTDRYSHLTLNQKQLWQNKLTEQYTNGQNSQAGNG